MKGDYFVEFAYHDEALKNQEKYKFMIEKYKQNKELITAYKNDKIKEITNFLNVLTLLETELKELDKLMPTLTPEEEKEARDEEKPIKRAPIKKTAKKTLSKTASKKPAIKETNKPAKSLKDLKMGLEQIKDELENM